MTINVNKNKTINSIAIVHKTNIETSHSFGYIATTGISILFLLVILNDALKVFIKINARRNNLKKLNKISVESSIKMQNLRNFERRAKLLEKVKENDVLLNKQLLTFLQNKN